MSLLAVPATAGAQPETIPTDTIYFDDGAVYIGQISDSLFNGSGKMIYADSTIYEGEWKNGLWDGKGTLSYPDGDSYTGEFREHTFNGFGKYIYADGGNYEGHWRDGMFNGAGTMNYSDGSIYSGEWKDDMKEGIGVYYSTATGSLYKGYFLYDRLIYTIDDDRQNKSSSGTSQSVLSKNKQKYNDGKFHYDGHTSIMLSYGLGQIFSIHADFHTSDWFFAGFQLGFNTHSYQIGEASITTDDETGEKITLVGWDWYLNEILTENTYPMFKISGECGISWQRLSLGTALGIGLKNTVRNCRSKEENDSYFAPGTLYYRDKITGVKFAYDFFAEYAPNLKLPWFDISLRTGYSNLDRFYMGLGISFAP